MVEQYGAHLMLAGFALLAIGWLWMAVKAFRDRAAWGVGVLVFPPLAPVYAVIRGPSAWGPSVVMALGLALAALPPLYTRMAPIDLGPRERVVDGERHITLNGWDRKDYSFLGSKSDAVVVQMANPDVTDATLESLRGFDNLRELDLNGSAITDAGLEVLKDLPALTSLRLRDTKITDAGFKASVAPLESLQRLDLTGTAVDRETVEAWKAAKPGRRAMQ